MSNYALSFKPSFNSGIPESMHLPLTVPMISELRTDPAGFTIMFNYSITSRKISFFLYLMFSGLHDTTFEAAVGTTTSVMDSCFIILKAFDLMNSFRTVVSVI